MSKLQQQISALQLERRKDAVVMRMAPRLQTSAEKLRVHLLGRSRSRQSGGGRGSASSASDLLHALESELTRAGKSPKAMVMLQRAKQAVESLDVARRDGVEREDELLQLLVEHLAPVNEEGGLASSVRTERYAGERYASSGSASAPPSPPRAERYAATVRRP